MNYQLVKNNDWKEVEINGKNKDIPLNWCFEKISQNINFTMGNTPKKENDNYEGDLPWITISDLKNKYITEYTAKIKQNKNVKVLPKGALLGSFKMSVGKFAFTTEDSATNEAIIAIKKNDTKHNLNYLYYALPGYFIENAEKNGQGLLLLNSKKINDINVLFPSIKEQNKICTILSKQESIISNIEKLIEKNEIIFNELSEQLLSGELRLKDVDGKVSIYKNAADNWKEVEVNGKMKKIPNDWCVKKIKAISKVCTGNTPSTKEESFWTNQDGLKWISTPDFRIKKNGYINSFTRLLTSEGKKKARICPKDTLLVSCIATIGEVGLLSEDSSFNQQINAILPNEIVSTRYLQYFFIINKQDFINYAPESVVKIVNKELFENYEVYFCSNYEQKLIENMLFDLENKIVNFKKLLVKEKEKFEWLLDNLLSGNYLVKEIEN